MSIVLPAVGVAFAGFCVWLGVRFINRRYKPGRKFWIGIALAALVAYPLSSGPFIRLHYKLEKPDWMQSFGDVFYGPLIWAIKHGPRPVAVRYLEYQKWWIDPADLGLPD